MKRRTPSPGQYRTQRDWVRAAILIGERVEHRADLIQQPLPGYALAGDDRDLHSDTPLHYQSGLDRVMAPGSRAGRNVTILWPFRTTLARA